MASTADKGSLLFLLSRQEQIADERARLEEAGYAVSIARTPRELESLLKADSSIMLIIALLDGTFNYSQVAQRLDRTRLLPLLLLIDGDAPAGAAVTGGRVYAVLPADVTAGQLLLSVETALARFNDFQEQRCRAERNEELLSANPDMLFLFNRDGTIEDFRAADTRRLLAPPERFLGRHVSEVLPADHAPRTEERIRSVIESGQARTYQYEAKVGGKSVRFEGRLLPYGKDRALSIVRDVGDAKRSGLPDTRSHGSDLFNLATVEGIIVHRQGEPVYVNDALCALTGRSRKALLFEPVTKLFHPEDRSAVKKTLNEFGTGEARCLRADGTHLPVEIESRPATLDVGAATVTAVRDISHHRGLESQLWTQIERMSELLKEVYNQVSGNLATLESFLRLKQLGAQQGQAERILREALAAVAGLRTVYQANLSWQDSETLPAAPVIREITARVLEIYAPGGGVEVEEEFASVAVTTRMMFTLTTILVEILASLLCGVSSPAARVRVALSEGDAGLTLSVAAPAGNGASDSDFPLSRLLLNQLAGSLESVVEEDGLQAVSVRIPTKLTLH